MGRGGGWDPAGGSQREPEVTLMGGAFAGPDRWSAGGQLQTYGGHPILWDVVKRGAVEGLAPGSSLPGGGPPAGPWVH